MCGLSVILLFAAAARADADAAMAHFPQNFAASFTGSAGLDQLQKANQKPLPSLMESAVRAESQVPLHGRQPFAMPPRFDYNANMKALEQAFEKQAAQKATPEATERKAEAEKSTVETEAPKLKKFPGLKKAMKMKAEKVAEALHKNAGKAIPEMEKAAKDQQAGTGPFKELFNALSKAVVNKITEFNAANLALTAWSFAKAGRTESELYDAMARQSDKLMADFTAQELTWVVWAFYTAGRKDPELFSGLARAAEQRMAQFKPFDLVSSAYSFAYAGVKDPQLFAAYGRAVMHRVSEFNEAEIENLAKAFTEANWLDKPVISAMARAAEKLLNDRADKLSELEWSVCEAGLPAGCKAVCSTKKGEAKVCPTIKDAGKELPPQCTVVCGVGDAEAPAAASKKAESQQHAPPEPTATAPTANKDL